MSDCEMISVKIGVSAGVSDVSVVDKNRVVRNVQTQHGDYRTVDEENIVVLPMSRCHSPEPAVDEGSGEFECVFIEPFAGDNQVNIFDTKLGHKSKPASMY